MIRVWTPELAFHDEFKPILSLSVSSSGRFATAGADHNIRLWRLDDEKRDSDGCPRVVFLSNISKHTLPVNVVRFSPDGKLLASASDDCNVMLWTQDEKQAEDSDNAMSAAETEQPSSTEPTAAEHPPSTAPAGEPVIEADNDVICLTPDSPNRSPARSSNSSAPSSFTSSSLPPSTSAAISPPSSPTATPFASDPDTDFSSLNLEQWSRASLLRGHLSEIYALHWSPDGSQLVTGSIEGRVVVWQLAVGNGGVGKKLQRQELSDHNGYVQGVGWDPRGELVVSASSDRTVRVYRWGRRKGKDGLECRLIHTLKGRRVQQEEKLEEQIDDDVVMVEAPSRPASDTATPPSTPPPASSTAAPSAEPIVDTSTAAPPPAPSSSSSSSTPLFVDETLPSFFRRPAWSPDGLFVALPAGCYTDQGKTHYCTWLYHRDDFTEPLACLTHTEPSVAAVFSPHPYRPTSIADVAAASSTSSPLPFAYLFIIATTKSILLYSTHSCHALASLTNLHLSALTDLAWATPQLAPPQSQSDESQQVEATPVEEDVRKKWLTEDRVLVSSSDGYISIVDMQGVAEKLDGEERKQWEEQLAQDVNKARKRIEEGEDSETRQKKRKRKKKLAADSTAFTEPTAQSAEGRTEVSTNADGVEGSESGKPAKAEIVFELTDEVKAQLQQMLDAGVQVTVDSVREHCKVSLSRATRMARKWREWQKQQRKQQAEAAAKAATERWEKMEREQLLHKTTTTTTHSDNGKEEKTEAVEEAAGSESSEKKRKERVKAPIVPVEDAKRMKKIDSFFTKSTTPQYAVAAPSASSSSASASSSSSSSAGSSSESCLPLTPLPLLPEDAVTPGGKRKIVPVLIPDLLVSTLTPIDPNDVTKPPAATATNAPTVKQAKNGKKKAKSSQKKKTSKKTKAPTSAAPVAVIAVSQPASTAPALFAVSQGAASTPPNAAAQSIDLTDEQSVPSPPLSMPAPTSTRSTAEAAAIIDTPAASEAKDTAVILPAAAASATLSAVEPETASTPPAVAPSGAVIVRQGSGSRRVMAGPPHSADEQPPAKKPKRCIVPTVIDTPDNRQHSSTSVAETSIVAVVQTMDAAVAVNDPQPMAVEVS